VADVAVLIAGLSIHLWMRDRGKNVGGAIGFSGKDVIGERGGG